MSKNYSSAEAREKLSHLVQEAEQGAAVERGSFWESYQEFRRKYSDLDTADAFSGVRDPSPGRDFSW